MVQRIFSEGLTIPTDGGPDVCRGVIEHNADEGVTWINSYVSEDKTRTFCVYDAPSPEAIRKTAARSDLPVDEVTTRRTNSSTAPPSLIGSGLWRRRAPRPAG